MHAAQSMGWLQPPRREGDIPLTFPSHSEPPRPPGRFPELPASWGNPPPSAGQQELSRLVARSGPAIADRPRSIAGSTGAVAHNAQAPEAEELAEEPAAGAVPIAEGPAAGAVPDAEEPVASKAHDAEEPADGAVPAAGAGSEDINAKIQRARQKLKDVRADNRTKARLFLCKWEHGKMRSPPQSMLLSTRLPPRKYVINICSVY